MSSSSPTAIVIQFPGSNGDRDLYEAFTAAGFDTEIVRSDQELPTCHVVGLPGGFAYGDYWRAGVLASQERAVQCLKRHVDNQGCVIGICNGFQILVESGWLKGALRCNQPPGYRHSWVEIEIEDQAKQSPWFKYIAADSPLRMPRANGEGNYFHPEGEAAIASHIAARYIENPNGSMADIAALLDTTGRVLGIMPHPERAIDIALGSEDGIQPFLSLYQSLTL